MSWHGLSRKVVATIVKAETADQVVEQMKNFFADERELVMITQVYDLVMI